MGTHRAIFVIAVTTPSSPSLVSGYSARPHARCHCLHCSHSVLSDPTGSVTADQLQPTHPVSQPNRLQVMERGRRSIWSLSLPPPPPSARAQGHDGDRSAGTLPEPSLAQEDPALHPRTSHPEPSTGETGRQASLASCLLPGDFTLKPLFFSKAGGIVWLLCMSGSGPVLGDSGDSSRCAEEELGTQLNLQ